MQTKILVVVNPVVNKRKQQKLNELLAAIEARKLQYEVFHTLGDSQQNQAYFQQHMAQFTDVISVGGDGTLNLVINAIADFDVSLGIVPCGTGNDFSRNIYRKHDDVIETVLGDNTRKIDLGKCNQRYFINVLGVGYDGALVEAINRSRAYRFRALVYLWNALKQLPSYKEKRTELQSLKNKHQDCFIAAFGNGQYFGNGMHITPKAKLDDGLLDCCWVAKTNILTKIFYILQIFKGRHLSAPIVDYWQDKHFSITTQGLPIEGDGEFFGYTPADIRVVKNAIRLKVPG